MILPHRLKFCFAVISSYDNIDGDPLMMNNRYRDNYKKWGQMITLSAILIVLLLSVTLFIMAAAEGKKTSLRMSRSQPVYIIGEYSGDGGVTWIPISQDMKLDAETTIVRGHFSRDIDDLLIVRFNNVCATLIINGTEIFRHGYDNDTFSNAPGIDAAAYDIKGTKTTDLIEMELHNPYYNSFSDGYTNPLHHFRTGNGYDYVFERLDEEWLFVLAGILTSAIGVFSFIIATICCFYNRLKTKKYIFGLKTMHKISAFSFFAIAGGYFCIVDSVYDALPLIFSNQLFCNMFDTVCIPILTVSLTAFCNSIYKNENVKRFGISMLIVASVASVTVFVLQIFGISDLYQTWKTFLIFCDISVTYNVVGLLLDGFNYKNKEAKTVLLLFAPLFVAGILEFFNLKYHFFYRRAFIRVGMVITILLQFYWLIKIIKKHAENIYKAKQLENELLQSKINIILSQMQPHFLYNVLGTIKALCCIDAQAAADAMDEFASFVKANMVSMTTENTIPFENELKHVESYLKLEKLRFPDRLNVEWDIRTLDLHIPAASLQILVENAVKHGVTCKPEGGMITIKSEEKQSCIEITVKDDGVGFDIGSYDKNKHIGLFNVENRIKNVGGYFEIASEPGKGTKAMIRLPKEAANENTCG